jgi:hypothetical protein
MEKRMEVSVTSRVLVVANQTVTGEGLLEAIKGRMAKDPCEFSLLVPATARAHRDPAEALVPGLRVPGHPIDPAHDIEDDYADARARLETGLNALQPLGATVNGEVGNPDPLKAIEEILARRHFDEIILSTLPSGASRWLRQDLPHKVERKFHLPVTVVTASRAASH